MKKWYEKFHDAGFSLYNSSGEATAVYIVRDKAEEIDTTGKWIDVISMNTYATQYPRDGFNWIIVELFPRITKPEYTDDIDENRYLTWHAAHDDIAEHRRKNHHGEKFIVLCRVCHNDKEQYDYQVTAFSRIKQKKINFIQTHEQELVEQIRKNHKPTLSILHISE